MKQVSVKVQFGEVEVGGTVKQNGDGQLESKPMQEMLGKAVSGAREKAGMTTTQLAAAVGISQAQVSRLENGIQGFRSYLLPRFAAALGTAFSVHVNPIPSS